MRRLIGLLAAAIVVSPEVVASQQASMTFTRPLGIERSHPADVGNNARLIRARDEDGAGAGQYVAIGALVGGLVAGCWAGYELYMGLRNGGETMINPVYPLAVFTGAGMLVGGVIGLSIYFGSHPK